MIGEQLELTHATVHQISTNDLEMRKICAKMVPKNLSQDQKDNRRDGCVGFLEQIENDTWNVSLLVTTGLEFLSMTRKRSARARNGTLQLHSFSEPTGKNRVRTKSSSDINLQTYPNGKSPVLPDCRRYAISLIVLFTHLV